MRLVCAASLGVWSLAASADAALDLQITNVRAASSAVVAVVDLRDLESDRFKTLLERGGTVHLRLQTELWESRPTWDRLVYPAAVRLLRLVRTRPGGALAAGGDITLTDQDGTVTSYPALPNPLPVTVRIGAADRLRADLRYYLRASATVGTIAEREIDSVGDAVFGRPEEASGLGSLGRTVFRRMAQLSDYLQSVTAETTSRNLTGRQLLGR
jgi:hypothetical protein